MELTVIFTLSFVAFAHANLEVAYEWKFLDWTWPNVELTQRNFTPGRGFTQDVDLDRRGRVFVTSPQWLEGVPIVLSTLTKVRGSGGHLLQPYPDWSWHAKSNGCNAMISVYRIAVISKKNYAIR